MELFAKIADGFRPLTIFVKSSILDVPLCSEYAFTDNKTLLTFSKTKAVDLSANSVPNDTFLK